MVLLLVTILGKLKRGSQIEFYWNNVNVTFYVNCYKRQKNSVHLVLLYHFQINQIHGRLSQQTGGANNTHDVPVHWPNNVISYTCVWHVLLWKSSIHSNPALFVTLYINTDTTSPYRNIRIYCIHILQGIQYRM